MTFSLSKPERTVARSFRINESTIGVLEEEAARQGVSVNTMANQVLTRFAKVDRHSLRAKKFEFTRDVIKEIFEALPEEKVAEIGRRYGNGLVFNGQLLTQSGGTSIEDILEFMKIKSETSGVLYEKVKHNGKTTVFNTHNINRQFSVYLASILAAAFEAAGATPKKSRSMTKP
jgi:hypothetical protein